MRAKRRKDDKADAAAICELVQRPNMRFVPVKTELAQALLAVHKVRQGLGAGRTFTVNLLRGVLSKFGHVVPQKAKTVLLEADRIVDSSGSRSSQPPSPAKSR